MLRNNQKVSDPNKIEEIFNNFLDQAKTQQTNDLDQLFTGQEFKDFIAYFRTKHNGAKAIFKALDNMFTKLGKLAAEPKDFNSQYTISRLEEEIRKDFDEILKREPVNPREVFDRILKNAMDEEKKNSWEDLFKNEQEVKDFCSFFYDTYGFEIDTVVYRMANSLGLLASKNPAYDAEELKKSILADFNILMPDVKVDETFSTSQTEAEYIESPGFMERHPWVTGILFGAAIGLVAVSIATIVAFTSGAALPFFLGIGSTIGTAFGLSGTLAVGVGLGTVATAAVTFCSMVGGFVGAIVTNCFGDKEETVLLSSPDISDNEYSAEDTNPDFENTSRDFDFGKSSTFSMNETLMLLPGEPKLTSDSLQQEPIPTPDSLPEAVNEILAKAENSENHADENEDRRGFSMGAGQSSGSN